MINSRNISALGVVMKRKERCGSREWQDGVSNETS